MKLIHALALALGFTAVAKAAQPISCSSLPMTKPPARWGVMGIHCQTRIWIDWPNRARGFQRACQSGDLLGEPHDDSQWVGWTILWYGGRAGPCHARSVETVFCLLRANGYRTGFFGKWHAKMPRGFQPADHFDVYQPVGRNPFYKRQPDGSLRHETEVIVDHGIEFIKNQPKGKPFAMNMWFNACHAEDSDRRPGIGHFPWPRAMDGMYESDEIAPPRLNDPEIFNSQPDFLKTSITRERFFWRWNTDEKYRTNMRAYLRMVSGIDNAIGRFLRHWRRLVWRRTPSLCTRRTTGFSWATAALPVSGHIMRMRFVCR